MPIPEAIAKRAIVLPAEQAPLPFLAPLYGCRIPAGFPSPAEDYVERDVDANELLITNKPATYFVWVDGQSMKGLWIRNGDIAVVDCSVEPQADCVVVAVLDGEMLIKQLGFGPAREVLLKPANSRYPTITVLPEQQFFIWGVVTWTLHPQWHKPLRRRGRK